jgi:hypothetical protein
MTPGKWAIAAALVAAVFVVVGGLRTHAFDKERPARETLGSETVISGIPCAPGYAWRYTDGRLGRCTLARAATIDGAALPAQTTVALEANGRIAYVFLPGTIVIEGHSCRGHGHDVMTQFHPGGRLKLCWLEHDEVIQGLPCAKTTFLGEMFGGPPSGVAFAADGRLSGCRISRDVVSNGRTFRRGSRVGLDPSGLVHEVRWGAE